VEAVLLVVAGVAIFAALALLLTYNRFVRLRNLIDESWHDIDTELQRRYDLIPNIVSTVKGYAAHEREVFDSVTTLRVDAMAANRDPDSQAPREQALGRGVAQLMAVAENYPDLKASQNFLALQQDLSKVEDDIQLSRRYYNATVRDLNILIQSFPSNLIAGPFGFKAGEYFEIENAGDRQTPNVTFDKQRA
jgi:LemA protein